MALNMDSRLIFVGWRKVTSRVTIIGSEAIVTKTNLACNMFMFCWVVQHKYSHLFASMVVCFTSPYLLFLMFVLPYFAHNGMAFLLLLLLFKSCDIQCIWVSSIGSN